MGKSTKSTTSIVNACPHRPPCPGCPCFGATGLGTHATRVLGALARRGGVRLATVVEGPAFGFRTRARLAVRGRTASPKIGIFQRGSHRIVDVPRCPIHHPRINEVAAAVKEGVRALGVAPYADRPHRGLLRYLQVAVQRTTGRAQVVLVANDTTPDALDALAAHLGGALGARLDGLWWNGNPGRGNAILGEAWHRWTGAEALVERLGGVDVHFHPGAFLQSNGSILDALVAAVGAWVPAGAHVLELYAGAGTLGLGLLARARRLVCNEASPHGLWGLGRGIAARPPDERARAVVLPGPAAACADEIAAASVVIADPPRRGLDPEIREAVRRTPPARVVLVSCDVDSLARDAGALLDGGLRLRAITPIAAFPHTEQVETVTVFDRP